MGTVPGLIQFELCVESLLVLAQVRQDRNAPAQEWFAAGPRYGLGREGPVAGLGIGVHRPCNLLEVGCTTDDQFRLTGSFLIRIDIRHGRRGSRRRLRRARPCPHRGSSWHTLLCDYGQAGCRCSEHENRSQCHSEFHHKHGSHHSLGKAKDGRRDRPGLQPRRYGHCDLDRRTYQRGRHDRCPGRAHGRRHHTGREGQAAAALPAPEPRSRP